MTSAITPTAPQRRIGLLDSLRGFAIFGILMVNMPLFFKPVTSMLLGYEGHESIPDVISEFIIKFFFEGKFYVLFSMLFGYGFYLFVNRQSTDGKSLLPLFIVRMLILLLFGILHVVFLWAGDILTFYALFGICLLAFRKVSDRGLIKWSFWLALTPALLVGFMSLMFWLASLHPESREAVEASMQANTEGMKKIVESVSIAYSKGSFSEIVTARLTEYKTMLSGILYFYPVVMAMFLIGVWAARKNLAQNFKDYLRLFRRLLFTGLTLGILLNVLYFYSYTRSSMQEPGLWSFLSTLSHMAGGVLFSLTYVSVFVLLAANNKMEWLRKLLAPVGRMALTNYLLHSVICTALFLPYGFGLFGKIDLWQGVLLTIVIFLLQIPLSIFWLKRFYFGPFEWLWRSLTYRKLQPFRKD